MVNTSINTLHSVCHKNKNIVVLGADFLNIKDAFCEDCKRQYIEMGIAESNLVGAASGMTDQGLIPFVYAFAPFLVYRANEFIRDDVCLQKRNVKMIAYSAGIDFCTAGPTHQTTEDVAMLRVLPNLTIFSPCSSIEVDLMIKKAAEIEGPVYIRLGRERNRELYKSPYDFTVGKAVLMNDGSDVLIISTGTITYDAVKASKVLEGKGIHAAVLNVNTIKPLDVESIIKYAELTKCVITLEEHSIIGGLGGAVAETLLENGYNGKFARMGLKDCFAVGYGNHDEIKKMNGLSIDDIVAKAEELTNVL